MFGPWDPEMNQTQTALTSESLTCPDRNIKETDKSVQFGEIISSKESLEALYLEESGQTLLRRCHLNKVLKKKLESEDGWIGRKESRQGVGVCAPWRYSGNLLRAHMAGELGVTSCCLGQGWWLMGEEAEAGFWKVLSPCQGEGELLRDSYCVCNASFP